MGAGASSQAPGVGAPPSVSKLPAPWSVGDDVCFPVIPHEEFLLRVRSSSWACVCVRRVRAIHSFSAGSAAMIALATDAPTQATACCSKPPLRIPCARLALRRRVTRWCSRWASTASACCGPSSWTPCWSSPGARYTAGATRSRTPARRSSPSATLTTGVSARGGDGRARQRPAGSAVACASHAVSLLAAPGRVTGVDVLGVLPRGCCAASTRLSRST